MILLDTGGTVFSAIYVGLQNEKSNTCTEGFLRHLILNQIRSINVKFRDEYGPLVLCVDAGGNWRKKEFPFYKANRVYKADAKGPNWPDIFVKLNHVMGEIRDNLPYKFIQVQGCEADDILGVLVHNLEDIQESPEEKCLIISNDKDMAQLLTNPRVRQFKPQKKLMVDEPDPQRSLLELIIRGDKSDGVPNIKSPNDSFLTGTRQKPISATFVEEVWKTKGQCLSQFERQRFKENTRLIDLSQTPKELTWQVIQAYRQPINNINTVKLLAYLASVGLNSMCEKLDDFK